MVVKLENEGQKTKNHNGGRGSSSSSAEEYQYVVDKKQQHQEKKKKHAGKGSRLSLFGPTTTGKQQQQQQHRHRIMMKDKNKEGKDKNTVEKKKQQTHPKEEEEEEEKRDPPPPEQHDKATAADLPLPKRRSNNHIISSSSSSKTTITKNNKTINKNPQNSRSISTRRGGLRGALLHGRRGCGGAGATGAGDRLDKDLPLPPRKKFRIPQQQQLQHYDDSSFSESSSSSSSMSSTQFTLDTLLERVTAAREQRRRATTNNNNNNRHFVNHSLHDEAPELVLAFGNFIDNLISCNLIAGTGVGAAGATGAAAAGIGTPPSTTSAAAADDNDNDDNHGRTTTAKKQQQQLQVDFDKLARVLDMTTIIKINNIMHSDTISSRQQQEMMVDDSMVNEELRIVGLAESATSTSSSKSGTTTTATTTSTTSTTSGSSSSSHKEEESSSSSSAAAATTNTKTTPSASASASASSQLFAKPSLLLELLGFAAASNNNSTNNHSSFDTTTTTTDNNNNNNNNLLVKQQLSNTTNTTNNSSIVDDHNDPSATTIQEQSVPNKESVTNKHQDQQDGASNKSDDAAPSSVVAKSSRIIAAQSSTPGGGSSSSTPENQDHHRPQIVAKKKKKKNKQSRWKLWGFGATSNRDKKVEVDDKDDNQDDDLRSVEICADDSLLMIDNDEDPSPPDIKKNDTTNGQTVDVDEDDDPQDRQLIVMESVLKFLSSCLARSDFDNHKDAGERREASLLEEESVEVSANMFSNLSSPPSVLTTASSSNISCHPDQQKLIVEQSFLNLLSCLAASNINFDTLPPIDENVALSFHVVNDKNNDDAQSAPKSVDASFTKLHKLPITSKIVDSPSICSKIENKKNDDDFMCGKFVFHGMEETCKYWLTTSDGKQLPVEVDETVNVEDEKAFDATAPVEQALLCEEAHVGRLEVARSATESSSSVVQTKKDDDFMCGKFVFHGMEETCKYWLTTSDGNQLQVEVDDTPNVEDENAFHTPGPAVSSLGKEADHAKPSEGDDSKTKVDVMNDSHVNESVEIDVNDFLCGKLDLQGMEDACKYVLTSSDDNAKVQQKPSIGSEDLEAVANRSTTMNDGPAKDHEEPTGCESSSVSSRQDIRKLPSVASEIIQADGSFSVKENNSKRDKRQLPSIVSEIIDADESFSVNGNSFKQQDIRQLPSAVSEIVDADDSFSVKENSKRDSRQLQSAVSEIIDADESFSVQGHFKHQDIRQLPSVVSEIVNADDSFSVKENFNRGIRQLFSAKENSSKRGIRQLFSAKDKSKRGIRRLFFAKETSKRCNRQLPSDVVSEIIDEDEESISVKENNSWRDKRQLPSVVSQIIDADESFSVNGNNFKQQDMRQLPIVVSEVIDVDKHNLPSVVSETVDVDDESFSVKGSSKQDIRQLPSIVSEVVNADDGSFSVTVSFKQDMQQIPSVMTEFTEATESASVKANFDRVDSVRTKHSTNHDGEPEIAGAEAEEDLMCGKFGFHAMGEACKYFFTNRSKSTKGRLETNDSIAPMNNDLSPVLNFNCGEYEITCAASSDEPLEEGVRGMPSSDGTNENPGNKLVESSSIIDEKKEEAAPSTVWTVQSTDGGIRRFVAPCGEYEITCAASSDEPLEQGVRVMPSSDGTNDNPGNKLVESSSIIDEKKEEAAPSTVWTVQSSDGGIRRFVAPCGEYEITCAASSDEPLEEGERVMSSSGGTNENPGNKLVQSSSIIDEKKEEAVPSTPVSTVQSSDGGIRRFVAPCGEYEITCAASSDEPLEEGVRGMPSSDGINENPCNKLVESSSIIDEKMEKVVHSTDFSVQSSDGTRRLAASCGEYELTCAASNAETATATEEETSIDHHRDQQQPKKPSSLGHFLNGIEKTYGWKTHADDNTKFLEDESLAVVAGTPTNPTTTTPPKEEDVASTIQLQEEEVVVVEQETNLEQKTLEHQQQTHPCTLDNAPILRAMVQDFASFWVNLSLTGANMILACKADPVNKEDKEEEVREEEAVDPLKEDREPAEEEEEVEVVQTEPTRKGRRVPWKKLFSRKKKKRKTEKSTKGGSANKPFRMRSRLRGTANRPVKKATTE